MELRDVQCFEVVVGRLDFGAFDDGKADGEENVFDFLKDLADQMMRADGAADTGERKVHAIASERGFFRAGLDGDAARLDLSFHMRAQFVELLADGTFQLGGSRLEPIVGDLRKNTGLAAEPGITELFPGRLVKRASAISIEASAKVSEERGKFLGPCDAEMDKGQSRFVVVCRHCI